MSHDRTGREAAGHEPTSSEAVGHEPTNGDGGTTSAESKRSRWLYVRVLIVQAMALIALWMLQAAYGSG